MTLELKDIIAFYRKTRVLDRVSFSPTPGSVTAIIGPNGAGKSTLLKCLTGEKRDYRGSILLDGTEVREIPPKLRAAKLAYLPQDLPCPHVTVHQLVSFGRAPYCPLTGHLSDKDTAAVQWALKATATEDLQDAFLDRLSGGQQKKAFFAMTLAQDTPLVVLDEPTAHLDAASRFALLDLIRRMCRETGKTILLVMHDLSEVLQYADRIMVLDRGVLRFDGTAEELLETPLAQSVFGIRIKGSKDNGYSILPLKKD